MQATPLVMSVKRTKKGDKVEYKAKTIFESTLVIDADAEKQGQKTEYENRGILSRHLAESLLATISSYKGKEYKINLEMTKLSLWERIKRYLGRK